MLRVVALVMKVACDREQPWDTKWFGSIRFAFCRQGHRSSTTQIPEASLKVYVQGIAGGIR
jgi:hypothetical protein